VVELEFFTGVFPFLGDPLEADFGLFPNVETLGEDVLFFGDMFLAVGDLGSDVTSESNDADGMESTLLTVFDERIGDDAFGEGVLVLVDCFAGDCFGDAENIVLDRGLSDESCGG